MDNPPLIPMQKIYLPPPPFTHYFIGKMHFNTHWIRPPLPTKWMTPKGIEYLS